MSKWLGLALMGVSVLTALVSGALAFRGAISVENVYTIFVWCSFLGVLGFVRHMMVVLAQWREK